MRQVMRRAMRQVAHKPERLDFGFGLINIVLLLLFFFIVTGSIVGRNEAGVAAPLTSKLATERLPRPLLVVDGVGALFFDEVPITLAGAVARMKSDDPALAVRALNVIADRDFSAERFLDIVDGLRSQGVPVRIITLNERAEN
jgi:biopolymer transport protein ExbD